MLSLAASLRNFGNYVPRVLTTVSRSGSFRFQATQTPPAEASGSAPPEQAIPPQQQQESAHERIDQQEFRRNRPRFQRPQRRGPQRNNFADAENTDSLNEVLLVGRVGSIDMTGNDEDMSRPKCRIALATTQNFSSPTGNPMRRTNWHRLEVSRASLLNSVVAQLRRGDRLFVRGRLNYDIQRRLNGGDQVEQRFAKVFALEMVNLSREAAPSDAGEDEAQGAAEENQHADQTRDGSKQ